MSKELEKIITRAIKKATANISGYQVFKGIDNDELKEGELKNDFITWKIYNKNTGEETCHGFLGETVNNILFSHDFAKAFWGEEWKDGDQIKTPMSEILAMENIKPWQHHLRQIVILPESERLKYLEKFI